MQQATVSPVAAEALQRIAEFYAIETTIRGNTFEVRQAVRQARSLPLVASMKVWLEKRFGQIPPRSGLADAIRYALSQWTALCGFLDDGRIELDTNTVERAIRPVTLGRKNHLARVDRALFAACEGVAVAVRSKLDQLSRITVRKATTQKIGCGKGLFAWPQAHLIPGLLTIRSHQKEPVI